MKKYGFGLILLVLSASVCASAWNVRSYEVYEPESLWEVLTYSQDDADQYEGIGNDLVGQVWQLKYNPSYVLDDSNSIALDLQLWARHGWFSLLWVDDLTGEQHPIAESRGAEGEGYYQLSVRVDRRHPLADRLLAGQGTLTSTQMLNRELPKPEYGTWYAGRYYVDILDWSVADPPVEALPPDAPQDGFPVQPGISIDPASGMITFRFELPDGSTPESGTPGVGYGVYGTTNLVTGEWLRLGDGFSATIEPVEDQLFIRMGYE